MDEIVTWLKRATGIGYEEFPSVVHHIHDSDKFREKTDVVVREVELLERELRRRGIIADN